MNFVFLDTENRDIESTKIKYSEEELKNILSMLNSKDKNSEQLALSIIYGMHETYIDTIIKMQDELVNNDYNRSIYFKYEFTSDDVDFNLKKMSILKPIRLPDHKILYNTSGVFR